MKEFNNFYQDDIKFDFLLQGLDDEPNPLQNPTSESYFLPLDRIIDADEFMTDINIDIKEADSPTKVFTDFIKIEEPSETIPTSDSIKQEYTQLSPSTEISEDANFNKSMDTEDKLNNGTYIPEKRRLIKKKRRLKGSELITSIKCDPVFSQHAELFDKKLDDFSRKKLMQKIRNRISAQESRDRRKVYIESIEMENQYLREENESLKEQINKLQEENYNLLNGIKSDKIESELEGSNIAENNKKVLTRKKVNGLKGGIGVDFKTGGLFLLCLICLSMFAPQDSVVKNLSNVKTNAIVPLNLLKNNEVTTTKNGMMDYKSMRMQDLCSPYCKDQCSKNEED